MNQQDKEIEKKTLIRNELLLQGYDPREFQALLIEKKPMSAGDLSMWTFSQL
jgi:hypothetical protein